MIYLALYMLAVFVICQFLHFNQLEEDDEFSATQKPDEHRSLVSATGNDWRG